MRSGRKSAAQTPAPRSERIKGSKVNPKGSAASKESAANIKIGESTLKVLEAKRRAFKAKYGKDVSLATLKAVFRRGAGAYSSSHRPTISGGKPNSRNAWAYARVNKFLEKKAGKPVKKAYVQDDDLLAKGGQLALLAPNGKPSNLTPEQYRLVRTPAFKVWFGDWENDPANASKVVDENGEPLVMYHGSPYGKFNYFEVGKIGTNYPKQPFGFYFTNVKSGRELKGYAADDYAKKNVIYKVKPYVYEVFLNIKDPIIPEVGLERPAASIDWFYKEIKAEIQTKNKDGVIAKKNINQKTTEVIVVALKSNQIKFADGSNVTFDPKNPDIRYAKGGATSKRKKPKAKGDCFLVAGSMAMDSMFGNPRGIQFIGEPYVVHAEVRGQGEIRGIRYAHAWVEDDENVYDFSNNRDIIIPKELYYIIGDIKTEDPKKYRRYTFEEARAKMRDTQKYGCWDIETEYNKGGAMEVGRLAKGMTLSQVAAKHGLTASQIQEEYEKGIDTEMEHTTNQRIAQAIALDHLYENPKYYTMLKKMEKDMPKYADGGKLELNEDNIYKFKTPTGEPSRLSYLQQVLVRTKGFKEYFGDWEQAAADFLADKRENFEKHYKYVSKVLDYTTLEPRVVYHGTRADNEFFQFDVTQDRNVGRPYGYFAHNREYSENFTQISQTGSSSAQPYLYECFLNIRNPLYANQPEFTNQVRNADGWKDIVFRRIAMDRYGVDIDEAQVERLKDVLDTQIGAYFVQTYDRPFNFWLLMAKDIMKDFKMFLITYGYDGIFYEEQFRDNYDPNNPREFTDAIVIFRANQVKLADGRNLNFNPLQSDIRFKEGGETQTPVQQTQNQSDMTKKSMLEQTLFGKAKFAEGGSVVSKGGKSDDGKKGGYFQGRSHAEGGIKAINVDTGQLIEVEGQEVIITKNAVNDPQKRLFDGKMMTNKEILSQINQMGGGVSFADGGETSGGHCGCSGKKYNFGGQTLTDFDIFNTLSDPKRLSEIDKSYAKSYMDDLISKMK